MSELRMQRMTVIGLCLDLKSGAISVAYNMKHTKKSRDSFYCNKFCRKSIGIFEFLLFLSGLRYSFLLIDGLYFYTFHFSIKKSYGLNFKIQIQNSHFPWKKETALKRWGIASKDLFLAQNRLWIATTKTQQTRVSGSNFWKTLRDEEVLPYTFLFSICKFVHEV